MKLSEIREAYEFYTGKTSDICRHLGFVGIGVIWMFVIKPENGGFVFQLPSALYTPLLLIIIALAVDAVQYLVQALIWYVYYLIKRKSRLKECATGLEEDTVIVNEPEKLNVLSWLFFMGKVVVMGVAYWKIGTYLYSLIEQMG